MKSVVSWILVLAAFMPLFVSNTLVPAIDGKVLVIRGFAFVLATVLLIMMRNLKTRTELVRKFGSLVRQPIFVATTVGIVCLGISTIFAFDRSVAFFGELERGEGFLTLISIYIIYVLLSVMARKEDWRRFWTATIVCSVIMFLIQVSQVIQGISRPFGTMGNPIFLASYYLFVMVAGACLYGMHDTSRSLWMKWGAWIAASVSAVGIILTGTRGAILGLLVAFIVSSAFLVIQDKSHMVFGFPARKVGISILAVIAAAGIFFAATFHQPFWRSVPGVQRVVSVKADETLNSRLLYLGIVREGFVDSTIPRKVFGWGWDNFIFFSNRYYDSRVYQFDSTGIDRPHNKLADMLIMTGIVGLGAYLALWAVLVRRVLRIYRQNLVLGTGLAFVLVAYFVHNLFVFDVPVTWFYFYVLLAYLTHYEES